uniref:Uncharacterized protein n=1 Tax=Vespula pensylvanica TaxID=30213 RepID=A0A834JVA0_VESPE|nr:hypothetical protein H0235_017205 [Vespula pensylvanica]
MYRSDEGEGGGGEKEEEEEKAQRLCGESRGETADSPISCKPLSSNRATSLSEIFADNHEDENIIIISLSDTNIIEKY